MANDINCRFRPSLTVSTWDRQPGRQASCREYVFEAHSKSPMGARMAKRKRTAQTSTVHVRLVLKKKCNIKLSSYCTVVLLYGYSHLKALLDAHTHTPRRNYTGVESGSTLTSFSPGRLPSYSRRPHCRCSSS